MVVARERINWGTLLSSLPLRTDPRFTTIRFNLVGPRVPSGMAAPLPPAGNPLVEVYGLQPTAVEAVRELVPVDSFVRVSFRVAFGIEFDSIENCLASCGPQRQYSKASKTFHGFPHIFQKSGDEKVTFHLRFRRILDSRF